MLMRRVMKVRANWQLCKVELYESVDGRKMKSLTMCFVIRLIRI